MSAEGELDTLTDEGFEDFVEDAPISDHLDLRQTDPTVATPVESDSEEEEEEEKEQEEKESGDGNDAVDCLGHPGWDRVDALAKALIKLDGLCVTNTQAEVIIGHYNNLILCVCFTLIVCV